MIVEKTKGYSGADMKNLCAEASMGPIREIKDIKKIRKEELRPIGYQDFIQALGTTKKSVS